MNGVLTELQVEYSAILDKDVIINFNPGSECTVMANALIKDVFSNLIGNAIKHSKVKPVRINLDIKRQEEDGIVYYKVIVEDNGPGIPDVQKEKLFARFNHGATKASGRGLGLYLVRTLVEDFHGWIKVEDRVPGDYTNGTRIVVMLPAIKK